MKTNGYIYIDSYILSKYCDKASFVYIYKAFHTEWAALLGSGSLWGFILQSFQSHHICFGGFGDSAGWNRLAGEFLDLGRASCFCVRSFIYFQPVLRT